jgi:hypothetical protein
MDGAECEVGRVRYPKLFIFGLSLLFTLTLLFPAC